MEIYYIYQIKCKDPNITDSYIGCTKHYGSRKIAHKHNCNFHFKYRLYEFMNNNGGWDNFSYELLESSCVTKEEAFILEKQYIQNFQCTLNMIYPTRSKQDIKDYTKAYQLRNKEKLTQYMKIYMRTYRKLI